MELAFRGEVWHWRGPSPYHFVTVPEPAADDLRTLVAAVTYGWGMVPVAAEVGRTRWRTSLFPKDGGYVLPLKDAVRRAEGLVVGGPVAVRLRVGDPT